MRKIILNVAILAIVTLSFAGCGVPLYQNGIYISSDSDIKRNTKTKVYYEDKTLAPIKDNLNNIVKYLNNSIIKPKYWCENDSNGDLKENEDFSVKCEKNNLNKQVVDIKLKLDDSINYITSEKTYISINEAYSDFINIRQFLFEKLKESYELRESLGTSSLIYYKKDSLLKDKKVSFTIQREIVRDAAANRVKKQIEAGGWEMVNNPELADKIALFGLTRDYSPKEVTEMKEEENTDIRVNILSNSIIYPLGEFIDTRLATASTSAAPTSTNAMTIDSTMQLANMSNSTAESARIGVGASVGIGILGALSHSMERFKLSYLFPMMEITDKKTKARYLHFYRLGIHMGNDAEIKSLVARISNSFNRWPEEMFFTKIDLK